MIDLEAFVERIKNDSCSRAQFKNTALKVCAELLVARKTIEHLKELLELPEPIDEDIDNEIVGGKL